MGSLPDATGRCAHVVRIALPWSRVPQMHDLQDTLNHVWFKSFAGAGAKDGVMPEDEAVVWRGLRQIQTLLEELPTLHPGYETYKEGQVQNDLDMVRPGRPCVASRAHRVGCGLCRAHAARVRVWGTAQTWALRHRQTGPLVVRFGARGTRRPSRRVLRGRLSPCFLCGGVPATGAL